MKSKTLLATLAVSSLMLAQPAAAAQASPAPERLHSIDGEAEDLTALPIWLIVLIFAAIGGLVVLVTDSDEPASP